MEILVPILSAAIRSGTPILFATLGEILTEKAGVLNLGLEGLMLLGAFSGFSATMMTGNPWFGLAVAVFVGMSVSAIHAFLCVSMGANQVVSGLAITMFGTGMSALLGKAYVGETIQGIGVMPVPLLGKIPFLGPVLFNHDPLVYFSYFLVGVLCWFIASTRWGLTLRALGENPRAVDSAGLNVTRLRYAYTMVGGGLASLGGAYLSVVYTQMWVEMMTAGRGWIAVALVIFGIWNPLRAALGSYLFGGVGAMQLRIQAAGTTVPAPLLLMLPYLLTIVVLVGISIRKGKGILLGAPAALGQPFHREERD